MESNTQFLAKFQTYYGKPFEIVSGRNAYTFNKEKHAQMLATDGIYLLLENPPQDNLKYRYDKALFIPARVADKFFPTNDPAKVKSSFHLAADKMRFEFYQQMHKLYQMNACVFKIVNFEDTRRSYRIDRSDYEFVKQHDGEFIFIFVVGGKNARVVEVERVSAKSIVGFIGNEKQSLTLNFELNAYTLKLLDDLNLRILLSKERRYREPEKPTTTRQETLDSNIIVEQYLRTGLPITIIFPEGKHELVLECTITKQERRKIKL